MKRLYIILAFVLTAIMATGIFSVLSAAKAQSDVLTATLLGDANCSGTITAADASRVLRHVVGLQTLTPQGLVNADVNNDGEVSAADAAMILRYVVGFIDSFDQGFDPQPTDIPTPKPTTTPKPTKTPKPTATPSPTSGVLVCGYCGTVFESTEEGYDAWYYHAWTDPGCYKYGRDMVHDDENPSPTPIPGHNGHWEEVWVVDVPAQYHTVWVCNVCQYESADWDVFVDHGIAHIDNDEPFGYHQYTVCDQEEQGHWEWQWIEEP